MPTLLSPDHVAKRDGIVRPLDRAGRHTFRAQIDARSVTRSVAADGSIGFKGHAIVFNTPTWIGSKRWGFWEQIAPEALTKTLQEADVRFLQNHDPNLLLARNTAGTLRLAADANGLAVDADMAPVSYAQDLAVLLDRGDISQMSFAFEELAYAYSEAPDGEDMYTVTELRLFDVSVVTYPAYETTDAGLRSHAFENLCRSADLGPADSRRLMRHFAMGEPVDPSLVRKVRDATTVSVEVTVSDDDCEDSCCPTCGAPLEDPTTDPADTSCPTCGAVCGPNDETCAACGGSMKRTRGPAPTTRDDGPPVGTTGTPNTNRELTLATLQRQHAMTKETL